MTRLDLPFIPRWRTFLLAGLVAGLGGLGLLGSVIRVTRADQQAAVANPSANVVGSIATASDSPAFQVTVIAILVTPGEMSGAQDQRLNRIKNQLAKLIPKGHGYKLLDVRSGRLSPGQAVSCDLGKDRRASVTLIDSADLDGKAKLRCELIKEKAKLSSSEVTTPLNQLFFCEHQLGDGSRLLIGVGAR